MAVPDCGKRLTMCTIVLIQYRQWTDRQTDRQKCSYNNIALSIVEHTDARRKRQQYYFQ